MSIVGWIVLGVIAGFIASKKFTLAPFGFAHALREARNVDGENGSGSQMLLCGDLFRTTLQIGEAFTVLRKLLQ